MDGLAFAMSSYVPGAVLSKLGIGAKLAVTAGKTSQALSKVHPALKFMYKNPQAAISLTQDLTGLSRKIDKFSSWAALTSSEALFEAKEVRDSIMNDPELWKKYDAETLRAIAAEKAANTFALNMAFLAPSNLLEVSSIFNKTKFGTRTAASRTNDAITFDKTARQFTETPLTGFQRFNKNPWVNLGKDFISNAAAEGFYEENIQYLISTLNQYNAHKEDPQGVLANFGEMLSIAPGKMFGDISDEQAQSILLGAAIGTGSSAVRNVPFINKLLGGDGGVFVEGKKEDAARQALIKDLNSNQDLRKLDVFSRMPADKVIAKTEDGKFYISINGEEREVPQDEYIRTSVSAGIDPSAGGEGEIAKLQLDEEGNPIVDTDKLSNMVVQHLRDAELEDFHNALSNHAEKNQASLAIIRNTKLANLGYKYFSQGLGSQLFDMIDTLTSAEDESLELLGVESPLDKRRSVDSAKKLLTDIEEVYNSVDRGMLNPSGSEKAFKERKKVAYDVGSRAVILDAITKNFMDQATESSKRSMAGYKEETEKQKKIDEYTTRYNELYDEVTKDPVNNGIGSEKREELSQLALRTIEELFPIMDSLDNQAANRKDVLRFEEGEKYTAAGLRDPFTKEYRDTRAALEAVRAIAESRQQLFEEWSNLTNLSTGQEYYNSNYDNLSRKDALKQFSPKLELDGSVTLSKYEAWEKRMKSIFRLRKRLDQIHQQYLGTLVEEWRTGHLSIGEIVDYMISNRVRMRKEFPTFKYNRAYNDIIERLTEYQSRYVDLEQNEADLVEALKNAKEELSTADDFGLPQTAIGKIEETIKDLEKELDDIKLAKSEVEKELGSVLTQDISQLEETIEEFSKIDFFTLSDNGILRTIADTFTESGQAVLEAFNNVDTYEDLDSIDDAIIELENLKKIFEQREELTSTKEFDGFLDSINDLLKQLTAARDAVEARIFDRNKKERRKVNKENARLFDLLGINALTGEAIQDPNELQLEIRNALGSELWNKLLRTLNEELLKSKEANSKLSKEQQVEVQANDIFIEIALEIIRSAPKESKDKIISLIDNSNEATVGKIKNLPFIEKQLSSTNKMTLESMTNYLRVALFNPLRSFRAVGRQLGQINILGGLGEKSKVGYDSMKESSLYRFFQTQDFFSLIEDLEKGTEQRATPDFMSEDLLQLSKLYLELYLMNSLKQGLQTQVSSVSVVNKELSEVVKEQKNKQDDKAFSWPASISQRATIYSILKFFGKRSSYPLASKFEPFMYLRGPAGSGKTNLVVR